MQTLKDAFDRMEQNRVREVEEKAKKFARVSLGNQRALYNIAKKLLDMLRGAKDQPEELAGLLNKVDENLEDLLHSIEAQEKLLGPVT